MSSNKQLYYDDLFLNHDVKFDEEEHTYTLKGQTLTSVTDFVYWFFEEFDRDKISQKVADGSDKTQQEVLDEWDETAEYGSKVHKELELKDNRDEMDTPEAYWGQRFIEMYRTQHDVELEYPEVILYNEEYGLAGTSDLIMVTDRGQLVVVDWKTSNKITTEPYKEKTGVKESTAGVYDTKYNKYALQLSTYAFMAEQMGEEIHELLLVHLKPDDYTWYPVTYSRDLVEEMLEEYTREQ